MNDLERIVYHANRMLPYPNANSSIRVMYIMGALAELFGLPIQTCAWCAEPGCLHVSAYDEPGWRCWEHRSA